jgi:hypothetical protein
MNWQEKQWDNVREVAVEGCGTGAPILSRTICWDILSKGLADKKA